MLRSVDSPGGRTGTYRSRPSKAVIRPKVKASGTRHRQPGDHRALTEFLVTRMTEEYGHFSTYTLAERIEMSQGTAHWLLSPRPRWFKETTLRAVADAFGCDIREIRVMAGQPAGEVEPFRLPDEVNQLDHRGRAVVMEVALALLDAQGRPITR